jgi:hypothetical protein
MPSPARTPSAQTNHTCQRHVLETHPKADTTHPERRHHPRYRSAHVCIIPFEPWPREEGKFLSSSTKPTPPLLYPCSACTPLPSHPHYPASLTDEPPTATSCSRQTPTTSCAIFSFEWCPDLSHPPAKAHARVSMPGSSSAVKTSLVPAIYDPSLTAAPPLRAPPHPGVPRRPLHRY